MINVVKYLIQSIFYGRIYVLTQRDRVWSWRHFQRISTKLNRWKHILVCTRILLITVWIISQIQKLLQLPYFTIEPKQWLALWLMDSSMSHQGKNCPHFWLRNVKILSLRPAQLKLKDFQSFHSRLFPEMF